MFYVTFERSDGKVTYYISNTKERGELADNQLRSAVVDFFLKREDLEIINVNEERISPNSRKTITVWCRNAEQ